MEIHQLVEVYAVHVRSWKQANIWCIAVDNGRTDVDDKQQPRHPCIPTTDDNVCCGDALNRGDRCLR